MKSERKLSTGTVGGGGRVTWINALINETGKPVICPVTAMRHAQKKTGECDTGT